MAQITVISGVERRRQWHDDQKLALIEAAMAPGASVAAVARHADVATSSIYRWRRELCGIPVKPKGFGRHRSRRSGQLFPGGVRHAGHRDQRYDGAGEHLVLNAGTGLVSSMLPIEHRSRFVIMIAACITIAGLFAPWLAGRLTGTNGLAGYNHALLLNAAIVLVGGVVGLIWLRPDRSMGRIAV